MGTIGSDEFNNRHLLAFQPSFYFQGLCIACEVCVRACPIDLPVVDWKLQMDIRKKQLLNYSIDFGICIFCGNCVEKKREVNFLNKWNFLHSI